MRIRLRIAAALTSAGDRLAGLIARREALVLILTLVFVAAALILRSTRPLWFDELFTLQISSLPGFAEMVRDIPSDGNPPLMYLLVRACLGMVRTQEVAVRLPSVAAFSGALFCVYLFLRRRVGALPALFGAFMFASSRMAIYGYEGRPYALVLGFTGLAMVSWQAAAEESFDRGNRSRAIALAGVTLGVGGTIASHHLGIFQVCIPLFFGEAVRLVKRRRADIPIWISIAAGLSVVLVTQYFARATNRVMLDYVRNDPQFWARPTLGSLLSYGEMAHKWMIAAMAGLIWLTYPMAGEGIGASRDTGWRETPAHEIAAVVVLALMVPFMVGITWVATGYYMPRYAIGSAMGIAILAGLAVPALTRGRQQAAVVAALGMMAIGAGEIARFGVEQFPRYWGIQPAAIDAARPEIEDNGGTEPIVVASALNYLPIWWYASPHLRTRLHYLADIPYAVQQPDFLPELSLVANQPYLAAKVDDYRTFVSAHERFLVFSVRVPTLEWTMKRLIADHRSLRLVHRSGADDLFEAEPADR